MKLKFKVQPYPTSVVDSIVNCFERQRTMKLLYRQNQCRTDFQALDPLN